MRLSHKKHTLSHLLMRSASPSVLHLGVLLVSLNRKQRVLFHVSRFLPKWISRVKYDSCQRSATSNNVTGKQSLSKSKKWMPGKAAPSAARTKVPAQVGWTFWCPVCSVAGKKHNSVPVRSLFGPIICSLLSHQAAAAGQWGRLSTGCWCCVRSLVSTST